MSLVKRVEIPLRSSISASKESRRKRPVSRGVLLTGSEKYHLLTACRFYSPEERKEKSSCLCACYLLFDPRYQWQDN